MSPASRCHAHSIASFLVNLKLLSKTFNGSQRLIHLTLIGDPELILLLCKLQGSICWDLRELADLKNRKGGWDGYGVTRIGRDRFKKKSPFLLVAINDGVDFVRCGGRMV